MSDDSYFTQAEHWRTHWMTLRATGIRVVIKLTEPYDLDYESALRRAAWIKERIPKEAWCMLSEQDGKGDTLRVYTFAPQHADIAMVFKLTWVGR